MQKIIRQIAAEIKVNEQQVRTAVELLDGGATVPFIARYRKEVTGGLDDIQLRELEYRLGYLRELEERRETVLNSIEEQGKLTPALRAAGTPIGANDLWIACHALADECTLVTNKLREFERVSGLRLENWADNRADKPAS